MKFVSKPVEIEAIKYEYPASNELLEFIRSKPSVKLINEFKSRKEYVDEPELGYLTISDENNVPLLIVEESEYVVILNGRMSAWGEVSLLDKYQPQ